jgi:NAD(P)H-hydrate repair Nnr-like enzyme with NAD(P)H-hydrate epimerase domain
MSDRALWLVTRGHKSPEEQARQEYLLAQNQRGVISPEERAEPKRLGAVIDALT